MYSAAMTIEKARQQGMLMWYDNTGTVWTWAPKGHSAVRRCITTRRITAQYDAIRAVLKCAVLE